jgi:hypothetical protein
MPMINRDEISHQTGAQLTVLPAQTTELMKYIKHANPVQIIYMHVPTFQASMCQYSGIEHSKNPVNEKKENTVLVLATIVNSWLG